MKFDVTVNGKPWRVAIDAADTHGHVRVSIKGRLRTFDASWIDEATLSLVPVDDRTPVCELGIEPRGAGELRIAAAGAQFDVTVLPDGQSPRRHSQGQNRAASLVEGRQNIAATMPGRVVRVLVAAGDRVVARQPVVVVEAMKMENEMRAPKDGVVREVAVKEGAAIDAGAVLVVIE